MRILFMSRWFPYPIENGSKIRIFNLLKGLGAKYTVDLLSFYEAEDINEGERNLQVFVNEIKAVRYRPFNPNGIKGVLGFFSTTPRSMMDTYNEEFAVEMRSMLSQHNYDLVIASEIDMAIYGFEIRGPKKIIEELEITKILRPFQTETNLFRKIRNGLTWWKLSHYVSRILNTYNGSTVVSEIEQKAAEKINPRKAPIVIPNGVDCGYYYLNGQARMEPDTLIFNGSITYTVNFKAIEFFVQKILPLIQAQCPQVRLFVTGKVTQDLINKLPQNSAVIFTGFQDDIRLTLGRSMVNVVPLTVGGGTRLKILEALAAGLPVVSTTIGAEGLDLTHGENILIADRPEDFSDAVIRLLRDASLRTNIAKKGRQLVETRYDWDIINQQLDSYIESVIGS